MSRQGCDHVTPPGGGGPTTVGAESQWKWRGSAGWSREAPLCRWEQACPILFRVLLSLPLTSYVLLKLSRQLC